MMEAMLMLKVMVMSCFPGPSGVRLELVLI